MTRRFHHILPLIILLAAGRLDAALPAPGDTRETVEKALGPANIARTRADGSVFAKYERGSVVYDPTGKAGTVDLLDDAKWAAFVKQRDAQRLADAERARIARANLAAEESQREALRKIDAEAHAVQAAVDAKALEALLASETYKALDAQGRIQKLTTFATAHPYADTTAILAALRAQVDRRAARNERTAASDQALAEANARLARQETEVEKLRRDLDEAKANPPAPAYLYGYYPNNRFHDNTDVRHDHRHDRDVCKPDTKTTPAVTGPQPKPGPQPQPGPKPKAIIPIDPNSPYRDHYQR